MGQYFSSCGQEGDATVVAAVRLVSLLEDCDNKGVSEFSRYFLFIQDLTKEVMDVAKEFWSTLLEDFCWKPIRSRGLVVA